ncbi:TetR/AcrR family transcriptional regulator [Microbacteriaceae bacterium VKM Ac-2854]|nr:TetR/AcrR family transcriptional regulator [Microbacteriaceae bacterium VKM Ac-2854]
MTQEPAPRRRGRPRKDAGSDARGRIEKAATAEFAERGYEAASLRAVARRAEVDPALVHHYFDDKAALFAATMKVPVRPDRVLEAALQGPREGTGERIVRALVEAWDSPGTAALGVPLVRTVIGHSAGSRMMKEFIMREMVRRIAAHLDSPDGELRASLAASQLVGLIVIRYVVAFEPLVEATPDELVARIGPVVQEHLYG